MVQCRIKKNSTDVSEELNAFFLVDQELHPGDNAMNSDYIERPKYHGGFVSLSYERML
jgi:hypothetical protein